jgi:hypothetical protein
MTRYGDLRSYRAGSNTGWIAGVVAMLFLLGVIAFTWNSTPTNMAGISGSAPASTTGAMAP